MSELVRTAERSDDEIVRYPQRLMSPEKRYLQQLPALELSIERHTESVPADGFWYLRQRGETLGRFRTLKAAKTAWDKVIATSGWTAPKRQPS